MKEHGNLRGDEEKRALGRAWHLAKQEGGGVSSVCRSWAQQALAGCVPHVPWAVAALSSALSSQAPSIPSIAFFSFLSTVASQLQGLHPAVPETLSIFPQEGLLPRGQCPPASRITWVLSSSTCFLSAWPLRMSLCSRGWASAELVAVCGCDEQVAALVILPGALGEQWVTLFSLVS